MPAPPVTPPLGAWLEQYVRGDQQAFTRLVRHTTPLVMAATLRRCGGRHALAQEAAQAVFVDLARRAPSLRADATLIGWLHQRATRAAGDLMKKEFRRIAREQQAALPAELYSLNGDPVSDHWNDCRDQVDAALSRLNLDEQAAVLLRCAEGHDFDAVGQALGCSAEAARKKVSRSLGKVRALLAKHRTGISAVMIAHGLAADQARAASVVGGAGVDSMANQLAGSALAAAGKITWLAQALPWLKALGTGTAAAAALWAWPAVTRLRSLTLAPVAAPSPPAAVSAVQVPSLRFPAVPVRLPLRDGLSLDEIVQRLAAIAEGPPYPDDFSRVAFYRNQIRREETGAAVMKLKRMVSPAGWHQFLQRGWSENFFVTWAFLDGPAALDCLLSGPDGGYPESGDGIRDSTFAGNLLRSCFSTICGNAPEQDRGTETFVKTRALMAWASAKLSIPEKNGWTASQRVLVSRGNDLAGAVVQTGDPAAIGQLLDLVNQQDFKWLDTAVAFVESKDTLATLMTLLPRLDSPDRRSKLQFSVLGKLAQLDPPEAIRQVEAMTDPAQRWGFATSVARPVFRYPAGGSLIIDEAAKLRADWWLQQALPGKELESARLIFENWSRMDPEWGVQWMGKHFSREVALGEFRENFGQDVRLFAVFANKDSAGSLQRKARVLRKLDPAGAEALMAELLMAFAGEPKIEAARELLKP